MGVFIGIDLGTSNSCIAWFDKTGRPQIIPNSLGENITPSVVAIDSENQEDTIEDSVVVGTYAYETWGFEPEKAQARFKKKMHEKDLKLKMGDKEFTPSQLSAFVLKKLVNDASAVLNEEIEEVVISIPANFPNEAREATINAGNLAGLKVNFIVNEPTAAALYYSFLRDEEEDLNGIYAVYDLGGGTFDFSLIEVKQKEIKILASNGIQNCGGDDFDRAVYNLLVEKFNLTSKETLTDRDFNLTHAEKAKKALTGKKSTTVRVGRELLTISREEFENLINSFVIQTKVTVEETLKEAKINFDDVNEVFLVGGSTRVPIIQDEIQKIFNKKPVQTVNPDEVVALGAALYAAAKGDQTKLNEASRMSIEKVKVKDISNKNYGTIALDPNGIEEINSVLIVKGAELPASRTKTFYTVSDNQDFIYCRITESINKEIDPEWVEIVWSGELLLSDPTQVKMGDEIEVTYSYDINQIMQCEFREVKSGVAKKVNLDLNKFKQTDNIEDIKII